MSPLASEPLSAAVFAPFGEVLDSDSARRAKWINDGTTHRFDLAAIAAENGGRAAISLFRATPWRRTGDALEIAMLECHPLGSQAFMPRGGGRWLVVVAPGDSEKPEWEKMRCFVADGTQGVNYHCGVWHHPLLVIGAKRDFWIADRLAPDGEDPNANLREFYCPPTMRRSLAIPPE